MTITSIAAFTQAGDWLDQARAYIWANKALAKEFCDRELPGVKAPVSDATYLVWADVSARTDNVKDFAARLRAETGLWLAAGSSYGQSGEGFLRINLACPRATVEDAMERLRTFLR